MTWTALLGFALEVLVYFVRRRSEKRIEDRALLEQIARRLEQANAIVRTVDAVRKAQRDRDVATPSAMRDDADPNRRD